MFVQDRIRTESEYQKVPLKLTTGMVPPKLVEAASLMESNIEEPISLEDLAGLLQISRRQLERLFKQNLNCSPSRYYMRVRLYRARQLLKQTTLSIVEIAMLCGFSSTPHFSKCYRLHLGLSPRQERTQKIQIPRQKRMGTRPGAMLSSESSFASIRLHG